MMRRPPSWWRPKPAEKIGRGVRVFLVLKWLLAGLGACIGVLMLMDAVLPMGEGSPRFARKWEIRLKGINDPVQAHELYKGLAVREFTNGEWIVWAWANSHGNPWGGTVVTKDSQGIIHSFFGHVCGVPHGRFQGDNLSQIYSNLTSYYGSTPEEWKQKKKSFDSRRLNPEP